MLAVNIAEIIQNSIKYIETREYKSYDLFDALTNKLVNRITKNNLLLRRIAIQLFSKSPIDFHWLGMNKMVHTKLISDLLWTFSLNNSLDKAIPLYKKLIDLKCEAISSTVWGLNFPYTSRFINAEANTPNIYNTATVGLAICELCSFDNQRKEEYLEQIEDIIDSLFQVFTFKDESGKGWFPYYPGQKSPTYNVNALVAYFLCKANDTLKIQYASNDLIKKLINLLIEEQNSDGSWYYSRSEKGKWIDGFHSGFIIESLAYVYSHNYEFEELKFALSKAWDFYIKKLFTKEGFPKFYNNSSKYPIESQNCAQAIQTLAVVGICLGWHQKVLLEKVIINSIKNLYNTKGYFYFKKTKFFTYKQSYLRWSSAPMLVALSYSQLYLETGSKN